MESTILRRSRRRNAFCLLWVAQMRRATDGAASYAAPDSGSDQHNNGTQDVNDPASGPTTWLQGRSGSFTSWVPLSPEIEPMRASVQRFFQPFPVCKCFGKCARFEHPKCAPDRIVAVRVCWVVRGAIDVQQVRVQDGPMVGRWQPRTARVRASIRVDRARLTMSISKRG
jgi:hypothetical protein